MSVCSNQARLQNRHLTAAIEGITFTEICIVPKQRKQTTTRGTGHKEQRDLKEYKSEW